jgi:hypothetical protein
MTSPSFHENADSAHIFGVPVVLTSAEAARLSAEVTQLWELTYGEPPGELESDLRRCRDFFDPTVRGHKLRERIASLPVAPPDLREAACKMLASVIVDAGEGRLIIGIEGRLLLSLLENVRDGGRHVALSAAAVRLSESRALDIYRSWSTRKLKEAVALRTGQGREVMQATSVGIVLALLVNRVNCPERAVARPDDGAGEHPIDQALHAAAAAFADALTHGRGRSITEQRLRGGYWLSEARRRLGDQITGYPSSVYIRAESAESVVTFVGRDLARRESLTAEILAEAFDRLVLAFRYKAAQLASYNVIFERPADTSRLREELLASFNAARSPAH